MCVLFGSIHRIKQSSIIVTENSLLLSMSCVIFFKRHNVRFCLHHTFIETITTTGKTFYLELKHLLPGSFRLLSASCCSCCHYTHIFPLSVTGHWHKFPVYISILCLPQKITSSLLLLILARIWMWTLCSGASVILANRKGSIWTAVALSDNFLDSDVSSWLTSCNFFLSLLVFDLEVWAKVTISLPFLYGLLPFGFPRK